MLPVLIFAAGMLAVAACNSSAGGSGEDDGRTDGPSPRNDGAPDGIEAGSDAGPDAGPDMMPDMGADAGFDGRVEPDLGADLGPDLGADLGPDLGVDAAIEPDAEVVVFPPGVTDVSHFIPAPVADLDSISGGRIHAFGGLVPPRIIECDVSGADEAVCVTLADVPAYDPEPSYLLPKSYMRTPFGWSLALLADDSGTPFDIVRFNEGTPYSVEGEERMTGVTVGSGSSEVRFDRSFPLGLAYHHTLVPLPEHDRFFIATGDPVRGMILCFADNYGEWASREWPRLATGLGASALATTSINLGSGLQTVLVALNSDSPASIDVFDPEDPATPRIKNIPLGAVGCPRLSEIAFDSTGRIGYVPVESPARRIAAVNLETDDVSFVDVSATASGSIRDMVVDGPAGLAYLACDDNSISRASLSAPDVRQITLGDMQPTALVFEGGYLYAATERDGEIFARLLKIEPAAAF